MRELQGKIAVVTGSAGGIGRGMAERFVANGMKVVLADIDADRLSGTEAELRSAGAEVLGVPTDVTQVESVRALAKRVLDEFGAVHVVCNNAGVNTQNVPCWEISADEWDFVVGVNLRAVIYGVNVFAPIMIAQDSEAHIVNTASAAGLGSRPGIGPYVVTKAGVVALTEGLYHDCVTTGKKLRASVLCPGRVRTRMTMKSFSQPKRSREDAELDDADRYMLPEQVGDLVVDAIKSEKFYIFTHPEPTKERIRLRTEDMLQQRLPTYSPPIF